MNEMTKSFYQMLYDQSPVSLWVEDFSLIYSSMMALKNEGVQDLHAYFRTYRTNS
jgi:hypothetical protein